MIHIGYSFLSVLIVSLVSFVGVLGLLFKQELLEKIVFVLVSLSVGVLFGDAFIHIIPDLFSGSFSTYLASLSVLSGITLFFVLEKFLHWHHTHGVEAEEECIDHSHVHHKTLRSIILIGDSVHNLIDGAIIAASYSLGISVGIATTLAVILHEIPQEIGDFGVLIHSGMSKGKALLANFISALVALGGVLIVYFVGQSFESVLPFVLGIAAGGFIYIAGSDLVPELHKVSGGKKAIVQFLAILIGFAAMFLLVFVE